MLKDYIKFKENKKNAYFSKIAGFTFIELLVVMTILAVLFTLSAVNIGNLIPKATSRSSLEAIISDLKQQQNKAMLGDTEGRASSTAYGVHFDQGQYVLFYGDSYDSADTSNSVFELGDILQFQNTNLPSSNVIFAQNSGELLEFAGSDFQFVLNNTANGQSQIVIINRYGVININ
jgi:prepilin-type N-terminal cleavage/methylation domain-containing protein